MAPRRSSPAGFVERGGYWLIGQAILLLVAVMVPLRADGTLAAPEVTVTGWILIAAGVALSVAGAAGLGHSLTPFPRPRTHATLRENGVYAWMRHPIYSGLVLAAIGWSLANGSIGGLASDGVLFWFLDRKAAREEAWLVRRFRRYARYRSRVRKLIPGLY